MGLEGGRGLKITYSGLGGGGGGGERCPWVE